MDNFFFFLEELHVDNNSKRIEDVL
jgi:hypothetical protein